jgi:hybrid cluster-associated redox disulfide protein
MICKTMSVEEVLARYPHILPTFEHHGMSCAGCKAALFESIEEGADVHGIDADVLIGALNEAAKTS